MGRTAALAAASLLLGSAAHAALPPEAYDEARREAPNLIVFDVLRVKTPVLRSFGRCRVEGRVIRSERGALYATGDRFRLDVPCMKPGARVPTGATMWQDMAALKRSAHGRAYLDARGKLAMGQYDLYDLR